jgi:hypothetical protein
VLKGKSLVNLSSIFMTRVQSEGNQRFGRDIYDNERLLPSISRSKDNTISEEINHIPRAVYGKVNTLAFGVWEFDITKIIHPTATVDEIINGWNTLVSKRIPMDLLFLSLFIRDVPDLLANDEKSKIYEEKRFKKEPEVVALLRLCYWYPRAFQANETMQNPYSNFNDKLKEIKKELVHRIRSKAKESALPILAEYGSNITDYHRQLRSIITERIKSHTTARAYDAPLDEIRRTVHKYASECMFYALGTEAGLHIGYDNIYPNKKAPNLEIQCIPAALRILLDDESEEDGLIEINKDSDNLSDVILHVIGKNRGLVGKINQSFQEGLFVVLDVTRTPLGDVINLYSHTKRQDKNNRKMTNLSLKNAVNKAADTIYSAVDGTLYNAKYSSRYNLPHPLAQVIFLAQSSGDDKFSGKISAITVGVPYDVIGQTFVVDIPKLPK